MTRPTIIESKHRAAAVVLAGGSGTRMGAAHNKVFLPLSGRRVVSWSMAAFAQVRAIKRVVLVIREQDRAIAEQTIDREVENIAVEIVVGGETRQQSELFALRHLAPAIASEEINLVLVHDGARPILSPALVTTLVQTAFDHEAAYPALLGDDIRRIRPDGSIDTLETSLLLRAQTPQAFRAASLLHAYECADADGVDGPDTVSCWERYNNREVRWVPGDPRNIKITYPQDLFEAEQTLRAAHFHLR